MDKSVWHYAPWAYLGAITTAGYLRPGNARASHEVPLLWFSANQQWEPTATKLITYGRQSTPMTFEQQATEFGCIRFGLPADDPRLLEWRSACRVATTSRADRRALETVGRRLRANPAHWFATVTNVPLSDLHFEVWLWEMGWRPANPLEMAEVWDNRR